MPSPLTQAGVEVEIMRLSEAMEKGVADLAEHAYGAAVAEADYKAEYAKCRLRLADEAITNGMRLTEADKDARAIVECEYLLRARVTSEALHESSQEALRTLRSRMDALRTISANIRAQT